MSEGAFQNDDRDWRIADAAWLGVIVERLDRGEDPFELDDYQAVEGGRTRFFDALETVRDHQWREAVCDSVRAKLYITIYAAARGRPFEARLWRELLHPAPTPPPPEIVRDLVARDIEVDLIGHLLLPDGLLWGLSDKVDEALLTLGKRRYTNPEYSADQFEEVLHAFPHHEWLMSSLPGLAPSDEDKCRRLARYVTKMPDPGRCLKWQSESFVRAWAAIGQGA